MTMKSNIFKSILLILSIAFAMVSCDNDINMDGADTTSLRVSLTPVPATVSAEGDTFTSAVVVNQGNKMEVKWEVSVDNDPSWVTVKRTKVNSSFTGTYGGDTATYEVDAVEVSVAPNTTGAKRTANLRFTVADNSSVIYTISQAK